MLHLYLHTLQVKYPKHDVRHFPSLFLFRPLADNYILFSILFFTMNKVILTLSLPLTILTIIVSYVGLFAPGFYSAETLNWQAQALGQDMIDLFIVTPSLFITSVSAYKNNRTATLIWGGVMLYLTYTFVLYCFNVHFNQLFVIYCLCLGLSFYSFLYFLFTNHNQNRQVHYKKIRIVRFISIYFIVIAILFYVLWLSEIVPSIIKNTPPKSITETGLFTNGVHVLDLSVVLPAIFITGILLLRGKPFGFVLAPVILSFFVLMDLTIGMLALVMKTKGIESDLTLTAIMGTLALISLILLIRYFKNVKTVAEQ